MAMKRHFNFDTNKAGLHMTGNSLYIDTSKPKLTTAELKLHLSLKNATACASKTYK